MRKVKSELAEYYRNQGVGRRRAEKLVKSDLARVKLYNGWGKKSIAERRAYADTTLDGQFVWWKSPEGHQYWQERSYLYNREALND